MAEQRLKAVIFCGGVGTRLWPMSRKNTPKQFQLLIGKQSIFQQTLDRVLKKFQAEDVYVSTGAEYRDLVVKQAPQLPLKNIIMEPERRDSLAAVGYATMYMHTLFPDCTMAAIWGADHLVEDDEAFLKAITTAGKIASEEPVICKVDVRPTFPSTYNGWVEVGETIRNVDGMDVYEFVRFVEKPDEDTAKKLFKSFKFLINTGYMAWNTKTMLSFFREHQPQIFERLTTISKAIGTDQEQEVLASEYPQIEKDSIDYGIFEKVHSKDMLVIPTDMGWTDIGTWGLLFSGLSNKETDNITQGETELIDSSGNLVWSTQGKTITMVGAKNLVVVDSGDSILVCDRNKTGDVKKLVDLLKEKRPELI